MAPKSSAHYQREYRKRLREQGLVKKEVWILPENSRELSVEEKRLRESVQSKGVNAMDHDLNAAVAAKADWNCSSLLEALRGSQLVAEGRASVELVDGLSPVLHVVMREYGDLPVFVSVAGEQMLVEAMLWPLAAVNDVSGFNEAVLRTHKYFPLSTISLDRLGEKGDYYHMFGALSASSSLSDIVLEFELLARNVIQATEAYAEFLSNAAASA